jgi:ABC-type Co2+ transport system permease subunit
VESSGSRSYMRRMATDRAQAKAELIRIMKWILLAAALMVVGALFYLHASGDLTLHLVVATVLGVFFSVLLGCGLFAAAFFSDKSGLDRDVADATRQDRGDSDS